jgi:hypothetical protein
MDFCQLIISGEKIRGRNKAISGKTITANNTTNMGTTMIMVSFKAYLSGTLATAQQIKRHMP